MRDRPRHGCGRLARALLAAFVLSSLTTAAPCLADDTAVGRDVDGVYPISSAEVEMAAEEVTIRLAGEGDEAGYSAEATCTFTFHNASTQPVEVLMGFPGEFTPERLGDTMVTGGGVVHDFRAFLDGTEVPATEEAGSLGPENVRDYYATWYTFPVAFAPDQTRTVTNTYRFASTVNSSGGVFLGYVLTTGGYWTGSIGRATVTVELGPVGPWQIENLYPDDWQFSPDARTLTWERAEFEPTFSLEVRYNAGHWTPGYLDNIEPGGRQGFLDRRAGWEELLGRAPGLARDELLRLYRQAESEAAVEPSDWGIGGGPMIRAAYLRSLLPDYAWSPPTITALDIELDTQSLFPTMKVGYADPDGDLVKLTARAFHRGEGGRVVVDAEKVETDRWTYVSEFGGAHELWLGFAATPGCLYTFSAEIEDSRGFVTSKSVDVEIPQPAPTPGSTAPTAAGGVPLALWFGLGAAGLAAVAAGLLLARGRSRGRAGGQ